MTSLISKKTLPHTLIKEKLTELIEQTFSGEGSLYLGTNCDPLVADFVLLCYERD